MHRSHWLVLAVVAVVSSSLALMGCETRTTLGVEQVESCDIDLENLDGMFVAMKASPDKGEFKDKDFRINFYEEGGKKIAMSTGGRIFPQLPLTQKFPYTFKEMKEMPSGEKEAYYFADLASLYGFEEKELEDLKAKNKDLGWKLEGMLYIRLDEKQCRLKIADMYATVVDGKRVEDFNMGGQSTYVRSDEDRYSMVDCPPAYHRDHPENNRQAELVAWDKEEPDPNRDESYPRDRSGTLVPTDKPVYWMFIDNQLDEKNAPEGCTYYINVYLDDLPVDDKQNIAVTPGKKYTYWRFDYQHTPLDDPTFIEIHRHKVCGGKDEIIDAVCNVVASEPKEPAGGGEG